MATRSKKPADKQPLYWLIVSPNGFVATEKTLDRLKITYGFYKEDLESLGWSFEAKFSEAQ